MTHSFKQFKALACDVEESVPEIKPDVTTPEVTTPVTTSEPYVESFSMAYSFTLNSGTESWITEKWPSTPIGTAINDHPFWNGYVMNVSKLCNFDFIDWWGQNCTYYDERDLCGDNDVTTFVLPAVKNADGLWETALNCPECGCGSDDGQRYLNDI